MNEKRRGNALGFWFFRTALRLFGLKGAYGLLYFVCAYYLLVDRQAVSTSLAYIRRRFSELGAFGQYRAVYQLFVSQGRNLIDRYYSVSGLGRFDIEIQGYDRIKRLLEGSEKGIILLTAHVGNWQVTMTALDRLEKTVYLLMTPEENAAVRDSLNIDSEQDRVRVISPEQFLGGVLEIMKVIDEGNIVSIMGDRSYGHSTVGVDLLGGRAYLPYSAFTIAMSARCPVVVLLSAKTGTYRYRVDVSNVIEPRAVPRSEKKGEIAACVQTYAKVLEAFSGEYPLQWFLFCDIWKREREETVN